MLSLSQTSPGQGGAETGSNMPIPLAVVAGIKIANVALPLLLAKISQRSTVGQQNVAATVCADRVERDMAQNRDIYVGDPNRTASDRQVAIQIFDKLANELLSCCGRSELGASGQRCISERIARDNAGNWIGGSNYDYPGWYLSPILDDQPSGGTGVGFIDDLTGKVAKATGMSPWIALVAMAVLLFVLYKRAQA